MIAAGLLDELATNQFFRGVEREQVAALSPDTFELRELPAGAPLVEQGSPPTEMFLVLAGTLNVRRNDAAGPAVDIVARGAGDFIGELSLLENSPRASSVYCASNVRVAALARDRFFDIVERIPSLYANLARTVAGRQRESDHRATREIHRYDALFALNQQITRQKGELERLNAELAEKNAELYRLATTDRLTGIFNRTYMMELLDREFAASRSSGEPLAGLLLDIDHFKSFNDTHGHQVGDFVLAETARCVARTAREGDTVCRYGGEEFLVTLPRTTADDAAVVAEAIRRAVEQSDYRVEGLSLKVTISIGLADSLAGAPATVDALLKNADEALYAAKRGGRNRVVRHGASGTG